MGRPAGTRNREYESRRKELLGLLLPAVVRGNGRVSLHELARATGASIPTLKHYFGDRSGAVAEALRAAREGAAIYIDAIADPGELGLQASLSALAKDLAAVWVPMGVGALFSAGLSAGLFDSLAGPGYLDGVLEPTLQALEARLRVHAGRGELGPQHHGDAAIRAAALAFLSPVLLVLLHQHGLSGSRCRPLDIDAFITLHTKQFVQAYGVRPARSAGT